MSKVHQLFDANGKPHTIGATGEFPEGKLSESDEGGISFGVASDPEKRAVTLNFSTPVAWLGMPPTVARDLAYLLLKHAEKLGCPAGIPPGPQSVPEDHVLLNRLLEKLHGVLAPLHGQEVTAEMRDKVNGVIQSYFEELEKESLVAKPYPRWRLREAEGGLTVEFHQGDMDRWKETHPGPAVPR